MKMKKICTLLAFLFAFPLVVSGCHDPDAPVSEEGKAELLTAVREFDGDGFRLEGEIVQTEEVTVYKTTSHTLLGGVAAGDACDLVSAIYTTREVGYGDGLKTTTAADCAVSVVRGREVYSSELPLDTVYFPEGRPSEEEVSLSDILSKFGTKERPFTAETIPGDALRMHTATAARPALLRFFLNLASMTASSAMSTEEGYLLEYDFYACIESRFDRAYDFFTEHDLTASVSTLYADASPTLRLMLSGITGKEACALSPSLPEGTEEESALSYLKRVLEDRDFYAAFSEGKELPAEANTLSELTVGDLVALTLWERTGTLPDEESIKEEYVSFRFGLYNRGLAAKRAAEEGNKLAVRVRFDRKKRVTALTFAGSTRTREEIWQGQGQPTEVVTRTTELEITATPDKKAKVRDLSGAWRRSMPGKLKTGTYEGSYSTLCVAEGEAGTFSEYVTLEVTAEPKPEENAVEFSVRLAADPSVCLRETRSLGRSDIALSGAVEGLWKQLSSLAGFEIGEERRAEATVIAVEVCKGTLPYTVEGTAGEVEVGFHFYYIALPEVGGYCDVLNGQIVIPFAAELKQIG